MSSKGFVVNDKRRKAEEEQELSSVPASLLQEDTEEVRITPETNFFHPGAGRIVVQEDQSMSKVGQIYMPGKTQRRPTTGVIIEAGVGTEPYAAGQKIAYGLYSGTVLTFKGWDPKTRINLRVLNMDEILGTVELKAPELEGVGV